MRPGGTLSLRACTTQVPENITKQGPSLSQKTCCHKVTRVKKKQKELGKGFEIPDQKKKFFLKIGTFYEAQNTLEHFFLKNHILFILCAWVCV